MIAHIRWISFLLLSSKYFAVLIFMKHIKGSNKYTFNIIIVWKALKGHSKPLSIVNRKLAQLACIV